MLHRILLLNPIVSELFDTVPEAYLKPKLDSRFELIVENLKFGTETIESSYDEALTAPFVAEKAIDAEQRGLSAMIISCFLDPGLKAAREVVRIPVIGAGESAMLTALLLGDSFSILDVGGGVYYQRTAPWRVRELGLSSRFRSALGTSLSVEDLGSNSDQVASELVNAARKLIEQDEPDVLVLGCTGLTSLAPRIAESLSIPVVDASLAALTAAQSCVLNGWSHSLRSYRRPTQKNRWMPSGYRLFASEPVIQEA